MIIGAILWLLKDKEGFIESIHILYKMAEKSPDGQEGLQIPTWQEISSLPEFQGWEWYKNYCYCTYLWKGFHCALILDGYIGAGHHLIDTKKSSINYISMSDVRDMCIKKAYGYRDKVSEQKVREWAEKNGYRLVPVKRGLINGQQQEPMTNTNSRFDTDDEEEEETSKYLG